MTMTAKSFFTELLTRAGIEIGGMRPWDVQVHDDRLWGRLLAYGSLGFGEAYMDGWWDSPALDECLTRLLRHDVRSKLRPNLSLLRDALAARVANRQSRRRAFEIGKRHYDAGNDLYRAMLDTRLTYTCGYWERGAQTLDEAQEAKLDLTCRKIGLKPGQRVLDIGCGWGSFAKYAAEKYGAEVVGITVSQEQLALGKELCAGLPVELRLQDYRAVREPFDHVVSLGMVEHVGYRNYRDYVAVARRCITGDGFFLLHTIGGNRSVRHSEAWIDKYIFPNSMLPSAAQLARAAEGLFVMEDWHSFHATAYDKTLMAWYRNVETHWPELQATYDQRFHRMWTYYLNACAGLFRSRSIQLWQIVFSPRGVVGGYAPVR